MKTPQDILLDRHRDACPDLDAIGDQILSGLQPESQAEDRPVSWWAFLKAEWIVPFRRQWAGMGVAWVAIALLQVGASIERDYPPAESAKDVDIEERLEERRVMLAELLEDRAVSLREEDLSPAHLKPRSDAVRSRVSMPQIV